MSNSGKSENLTPDSGPASSLALPGCFGNHSVPGVCWHSEAVRCPVVELCAAEVKRKREAILSMKDELAPEKYVEAAGLAQSSRAYMLSILHNASRVIGKPLYAADQADALRIAKWLEGYRGRAPKVYGRTINAYLNWVGRIVPSFRNPLAAVRLPNGTRSQKREALSDVDLKRLLEFIRKYDKKFWEELVILTRHFMRVGELYPTSMSQLKTVCDCKGTCKKEHDYQFLPGGTVRFRVKGAPNEKRWSAPERFSVWELRVLRRILQKPTATKYGAIKRLERYANRLGINLVNEDGQRIPVSTHILRHTVATIMSPALDPESLKRAAHVRGKGWERTYVHPRPEHIEKAKEEVLSSILRVEE